MSRLTRKNNQGTGSWTQFGDKYIPAHNIKHKQCVNKLGKLEDLEEQLGCPLEVVFKALKEKLEYIANGVRIEGTLSHIYYSIGGYWMGEFVPKCYILGEIERLTKRIPLKDYGTTWWLKGEKGNEED